MTDVVPYVARDIVDGWVEQVAGVAKLADYIATTPFVPDAYRGHPAAVAAAILTGRELGIGPMTSLQHLYVVDGRPAMSAQLMRALVLAHGHTLRVTEATSARCTIVGRRAGDSAEYPVTWTIDDARQAGLLAPTKSGKLRTGWKNYPRAMLLARATGELCRGIFPDVIGGMAYTLEEAQEIPEQEEAPQVGRTRTIARTRTPPARESAPPTGPGPAANEQPAAVTPSTRARPQAPPLPQRPVKAPQADAQPKGDQPPPDESWPSQGQRNKLEALLHDLDRDKPRARRIHTLSGLAGRRLISAAQLTRDEHTALIDTLERLHHLSDGYLELDQLVTAGWQRITANEDTLPIEPPDDA